MKEDIHNLIGGQSFGSIEEVQAVFNQYQQQKNEDPVKEFHGLSSEQMHRFLHMPFESPELITLPLKLEIEPENKATFLLSMLIDGGRYVAALLYPAGAAEICRFFWPGGT